MRIGDNFNYTQIYNDRYSAKIRESLQTRPAGAEDGRDAVNVSTEKAEKPEEQAVAKRDRLLGLEDVSLSFNKNDDFDLIGKTSDITDLDIQKAVSDSKKDDILNMYAPERGATVYSGDEGIVIAK